MSKKPRFDSVNFEAIQAKPGAGRAQEAFHEKPAPTLPEPGEKPGDIKARAVSMTLYLMPEDHKRLRRLAVDKDAAIQTLLLDAIDRLFADEGMAPIERWAPRRKAR